MPPCCSRQLQPYAWIDDPPGVHGRTHCRIAARAGEVEQPQSLHEERPLFTEEDREALIDFDLEGIAFYLAEVGIDRGVEGNRRCQSVLHAHAQVSPGAG